MMEVWMCYFMRWPIASLMSKLLTFEFERLYTNDHVLTLYPPSHFIFILLQNI